MQKGNGNRVEGALGKWRVAVVVGGVRQRDGATRSTKVNTLRNLPHNHPESIKEYHGESATHRCQRLCWSCPPMLINPLPWPCIPAGPGLGFLITLCIAAGLLKWFAIPICICNMGLIMFIPKLPNPLTPPRCIPPIPPIPFIPTCWVAKARALGLDIANGCCC